MQHELATDQASHEPPPEQSNLMQLRHGLGISFVPDEGDLAGTCSYSDERVTALIAELMRRTDSLTWHTDYIANAVQPIVLAVTPETYGAILDDLKALQEQVTILFDENKALRLEVGQLRQARAA